MVDIYENPYIIQSSVFVMCDYRNYIKFSDIEILIPWLC
jgi:hypothetical protein